MIPWIIQKQIENVLEFHCSSLRKHRFGEDEDTLRTCCFPYCWQAKHSIFFIVFHSGYLCRAKETTKITFSSFLATLEKTYSWKKIKQWNKKENSFNSLFYFRIVFWSEVIYIVTFDVKLAFIFEQQFDHIS